MVLEFVECKCRVTAEEATEEESATERKVVCMYVLDDSEGGTGAGQDLLPARFRSMASVHEDLPNIKAVLELLPEVCG